MSATEAVITAAAIGVLGAVLGAILGAIVGGFVTYKLQQMQIDNEARIRKQQIELESQIRIRAWALTEYAGRTTALQSTLNLVEKLYRSQMALKDKLSLEKIKDDLLQSLLEPDLHFVGRFYSELELPCGELVQLITQVAEMDDLRSQQAKQTLQEAHNLSLKILDVMIAFKKDLAEGRRR